MFMLVDRQVNLTLYMWCIIVACNVLRDCTNWCKWRKVPRLLAVGVRRGAMPRPQWLCQKFGGARNKYSY